MSSRRFCAVPGGRGVAALPQLRRLEVQSAQGIQARSIPVLPGRALIRPLMLANADQVLNIGLYDQLQYGLGDSAKRIATGLPLSNALPA